MWLLWGRGRSLLGLYSAAHSILFWKSHERFCAERGVTAVKTQEAQLINAITCHDSYHEKSLSRFC